MSNSDSHASRLLRLHSQPQYKSFRAIRRQSESESFGRSPLFQRVIALLAPYIHLRHHPSFVPSSSSSFPSSSSLFHLSTFAFAFAPFFLSFNHRLLGRGCPFGSSFNHISRLGSSSSRGFHPLHPKCPEPRANTMRAKLEDFTSTQSNSRLSLKNLKLMSQLCGRLCRLTVCSLDCNG